MLKDIKRKQDGFTIIEVMIVLVIAAVILLIVFLAVPALQRNSRNTQRKNEVSRLSTAVDSWRANNSNKVPNICIPVYYCSPADQAVLDQILNDANVSYFDRSNIWILTGSIIEGSADPSSIENNIKSDNVMILTNAKCNADQTISSGPSTVIWYPVEGGNGFSAACV